MNLNFSNEDLAFQQEVRHFFANALPDDLRDRARRGLHLTKEEQIRWHHILNVKGWLVPGWPEEYGGTGWSLMQKYIYSLEAARAGAPMVSPFGVSMIGPVLIRYGSEAQKARYLPRILNSDDWWCQGYSEPEAGSDLASLKTRAQREGDHYIVNGQKIWTTQAQHANLMFCLVRTDPDAKKQQGISMLVIDMQSPGIEVRPIISLDLEHSLNEVFFSNVKVPADNLVGEENQGWTYAKSLLDHERAFIARVANSQYVVDRIKEMAASERCDGQPLLANADFRRKLTALEIDLKALQYTELRYLDMQTQGISLGPQPSLLKLEGSRLSQGLKQLMVECLGSSAMLMESDNNRQASDYLAMGPDYMHGTLATHFYARSNSIAGGTSEVQRNVIARFLLRGEVVCSADWGLTEEQSMLKAAVDRFVAEHYSIQQRAALVSSDTGFSREHWRLFADMGWLALPLPEQFGGLGGDAVDVAVLMEGLGRGLVLEPYLSVVIVAAGLLAAAGSEAQKQQFLPAVASGELMLVFAGLERQSRFNLADVETTATREGDFYRLNGRKSVVYHGAVADKLLLSARTSGNPRDREGLSLFLLDADAGGLQRLDAPTTDGQRASDFILDNVRVPASARIGGEGRAWPVLETIRQQAISAVSAEALGAMEALNHSVLNYLQVRKQFNTALSSFQVLQHRLADLYVEVELARAVSQALAMTLSNGGNKETEVDKDSALLASAAKARIAKAADSVGRDAVQLHGGIGMTDEYAISHYYKRLMMIDLQFGNRDYHRRRFEQLSDNTL